MKMIINKNKNKKKSYLYLLRKLLQLFVHQVPSRKFILQGMDMNWSQRMTYLFSGLILLGNTSWAETLSTEQVQVTSCLANHLTKPYEVISENKSFKIINLSSDKLTSLVLLSDKINCGRFINVTEQLASLPLPTLKKKGDWLLAQKKITALNSTTYTIKHSADVIELMDQINLDNILSTLTRMTEFKNRSATKKSGVDTASWLKTTFEKIAVDTKRTDVATYFVQTGMRYKQPSLVTVIGKDLKKPAIVIGAHMDTLDGIMPGAGDDASGSADIMEIARVLMSSSVQLKRPVYFIWYAAEERGLVGSQFVVKEFLKILLRLKRLFSLI